MKFQVLTALRKGSSASGEWLLTVAKKRSRWKSDSYQLSGRASKLSIMVLMTTFRLCVLMAGCLSSW